MHDFIFSLNAVLPTFMIMFLGFFFKKIGRLSDEFVHSGDKFWFGLMMPLMLFTSVYKADLKASFDAALLVYVLVFTVAMNIVSYVVIRFFVKSEDKKDVLMQAMTRSNIMVVGVPICTAIFGQEGNSAICIIAACYVPVSNALAILGFSVFGKAKTTFKGLMRNIVTNPFIQFSVAGFIVQLLGIRFPTVVESVLTSTSTMTSTMVLMLLGAEFEFKSLKENLPLITLSTAFRLVIFPFAAVYFAYRLGMGGIALAVIMSTFAAPNAIAGYSMAKMFGGDCEFTGQTVVISTLLSSVTIFGFIYVMKSMGLI